MVGPAITKSGASDTYQRSRPRFHFSNWLARPVVGKRRFMTVPVCSLVDEVQFGSNKDLHRSAMNHFICAGDQDPYIVTVAESSTTAEVAELLDADLEYRSTDSFARRVRAMEQGIAQKFHGRFLESRADVDEYFAYQVRLILSIMNNGLRSQRELSKDMLPLFPEFSPKRPTEHEIGCAIGPGGETWMFRTGHHRLHIAREFGFSNIIVEVHFVHWKWIASHARTVA